MTVHGGVVEVRAELVHRILRLRGHEDLSAESDDRLLGRAVTIVRVALTVELDQTLVVLLGPEDVVREEAVSVVGRLLSDLRRADGSVPDERRYSVEGAASR